MDPNAGRRLNLESRPPNIETDNRASRCHGFDDRPAPRVVKARMNQDVAFRKDAQGIPPMQSSEEANMITDSKLESPALKARAKRSISNEPELSCRESGLRNCERFQPQVESFEIYHAAHADESDGRIVA